MADHLSGKIGNLSPEQRAQLQKKLLARKKKPENEAAGAPNTSDFAPIHRHARGPVLSSGQERLWFLQLLVPESTAYNVAFAFQLVGPLDSNRFRNALNLAAGRHEVLRTRFANQNGSPVLVLDQAAPELTIVDLTSLPADQQHAALHRNLERDARQSFHLDRDLMLRAKLYRCAEDQHTLSLSFHHIATDGWSVSAFLRDAVKAYDALKRDEQFRLPELPLQYSDFAAWQREQLSGAVLDQQVEFWKKFLNSTPLTLELPTDHARPAEQSYRGATLPFHIPQNVAARLREFAKRQNTTFYMTLLAGFELLISRYSGQKDFTVGIPVAVRSRPELDELCGFFVNTLVIPCDVDQGSTYRELVAQVQQRALEAFAHPDLPFEKLVEELHIERDTGRSPLFEVLFAFQEAPKLNLSDFGVSSTYIPLDTAGSKFDLSFYVEDSGSAVALNIEYSTDLFESTTIERMVAHYFELLSNLVNQVDVPVRELPMLTTAERQQILIDFNATGMEYPREASLASLVEAQVERTPDAVAVRFGEEPITYRELNEQANQLARELQGQGAGPDVLVGVYVERSIGMMVGLLAIMKAGAAYLPLDPFLPQDRLRHMIEDSSLTLLLTEAPLLSSLPESTVKTVLLDDPAWRKHRNGNLDVAVRPESLAYVIYTSGSTGKPKGVQVPRRALSNLLCSMREWLQLQAKDRVLAVTTISFDIAGVDIWLPWLVGAETILVSRADAADGAQLRRLMEQHKVSFLQATPVTWRLLLEAGWGGSPDLQMVCTGEAMPQDLATQLTPIVRRLWNLYGPTETTIWSTGYQVRDGQQPVLIGKPVGNTQCYILDQVRQPVPVGVAGELHIAGDGLARGYLNRPELTAEKFLANPFAKDANARMYRTGDLARYHEDGNIECLGRTDHQVKIRGYRIELGEIESALKEQAGVRQAVVIAREDRPGDKRLVAYLVASEPAGVEREQLRSTLKKILPDYMVPSEFVILDQIPISPNGKIDRKALPALEMSSRAIQSDEMVAPRTPVEKKIAEIFCKVLSPSEVGIHDDFFDLGGHSLSAARVISLINSEFGVNLPVRILFQAQTVAALTEAVEFSLTKPAADEWPTLIPIQPNGTQSPLFCVARPNVNALGYVFLSRQLGTNQPVYGLQRQLQWDPVLDFSNEQYQETAREYIRAMQSVQPKGPYHFLGLCQGAYIAFEMARQLEKMGEKIAFLGILDAWTEENTRIKWLTLSYFYLSAFRRRFVPKLLRKFRKGITTASSPADQSGNVAAHAAVDFQSRWKRYWPGKDFVAPRCNSKITVFRVRDQFFYRKRDLTLGWKDRSSIGVETEAVPGDHLTLLREPNVAVLASKIAAHLSKNASSATSSVGG